MTRSSPVNAFFSVSLLLIKHSLPPSSLYTPTTPPPILLTTNSEIPQKLIRTKSLTMADNCLMSSMDSWAFRSSSITSDSLWPSSLSDSFLRDSDALTRALLFPLSSDNNSNSDTGSPPETLPLPKPEPPVNKTQTHHLPCSPSARISKRKSRASKKTPTTYITADPANFRQMVQQVTGVRVGDGGHVPVEAVVRPEAVRGGVGMGLGLPTLDTSAVLLDRARMAVGSADGNGSGFELDGFASFPTLESWTAM